MRNLDDIDRRILRELQDNARISNVDLSRRVNLSQTPCLERVRRLERDGFIQRYAAILDPVHLGQSQLVFVEVSLDRTTSDVFETFRAAIAGRPEVLECHMVAGGFDYLLKIRVTDMTGFRLFLEEGLNTIPGVRESSTYVVMEEIKETTAIPVV